MATATVNVTEIAAQWRTARRIYPTYSALTRSFEFGVGPCRELESPINRSEPEVMVRVNNWFALIDEKLQVHQLRQTLQTTHVATEESLRDMLLHQLTKKVKSSGVRDKVDYLSVQYYCHCAANDSGDKSPSLAQVEQVLRPILGELWQPLPPFAREAELETIVQGLEQCASLRDLVERKIIERGREIKDKAGEDYFAPSAMVAFARFNFIVRQGFFRLMQSDLHAIRLGLHELEGRGQESVDCSAAGLSEHEPIATLREICEGWKTAFRAAYSVAANFRSLLGIGTAVATALALPPPGETKKREPEAAQHVAPAVIKTAPPIADELPRKTRAAADASAKLDEVAASGEPKGTKVPEPRVVKPKDAPIREVAPKPKAAEEHKAVVQPAAGSSLENFLEQIAEKLISGPTAATSVSIVILGATKLMLASWEVAAFVRGGDDVSDTLQRAVAARAMLQIAVDGKRLNSSLDVIVPIGVAHAEAAVMQERIAEAKDKKNIDGAVNMAATAKRLLAMIDEAEKS